MRRIIIVSAVYLVALEGVLLVLLALKQNTTEEKLTVFISGGIVLVVALTIMKILKRLISKSRTHVSFEFFTPLDTYAFPSGHATGLSALTFFIIERNVMLGIMSIFLGIIVIVTRVKAKAHDYIDIIGGIILGVGVAYYISQSVESSVSNYLITHMFS